MITSTKGRMLCDWCDAPAVALITYPLGDSGAWTDHACATHGRQYFDTYATAGAVFVSVSA